MTVSADDSSDPNNKPLKYEWKVLRGDPDGVKIVPKNEAGSVVEIAVRYPERRPISPGSLMESSRVDIGVFVNNGHHWSAPAFITWQGLENEIRDFRLSGAELSDEKKQRYAAIMAELARLSTKFSENVLDATNAFSVTVDGEIGRAHV